MAAHVRLLARTAKAVAAKPARTFWASLHSVSPQSSGHRKKTNDGNLKALLLPCPADQMLMWEISPQVNSPKNDDVNTGSDRDDGKRLTRFDVAISHIGFAGSNDEPSRRKSGSRD